MEARLIGIQQPHGVLACSVLEFLECGLFHGERFFVALFLSV
jgi:hypothetical protein